MALIFDDPCLDRRQLSYLMPERIACDPRLLDLRRQAVSAVLALLRQHRSNLIDFSGSYQGAVRSSMAGLSTHFPLALLPPAPFARRTCQSIGGRRLGGICGVLFAQRQLALQIGNLVLFFADSPLVLCDSLRLLGQLLAQRLDLAAQALVFAT